MSFSGITDKDTAHTITNDGFWPDIELLEFQKNYRLPAEYYSETLIDNIKLGILWANRQLVSFKIAQEKNQTLNLASVPGEMIGGELEHIIRYKRIVYCYSKALLLKQFATMSRRDGAKNEAKESEETEDKFMEMARAVVSDFLSNPRIGVHLI